MKNVVTYRPINHGRQGSTGGNSVYVAIAGEVVNRRSVLLIRYCTYTQTVGGHAKKKKSTTDIGLSFDKFTFGF